jgi:hypothetical protein
LNHAPQSNADSVALSDPLDVAAHPSMVFLSLSLSAYYVIDWLLNLFCKFFPNVGLPQWQTKIEGGSKAGHESVQCSYDSNKKVGNKLNFKLWVIPSEAKHILSFRLTCAWIDAYFIVEQVVNHGSSWLPNEREKTPSSLLKSSPSGEVSYLAKYMQSSLLELSAFMLNTIHSNSVTM